MATPHHIVVLVGSLRKESFTLKIANALAKLAPDTLKLNVVTLHDISFFNQDLEATPPADWLALREKIQKSAGVLFVTKADDAQAFGLRHSGQVGDGNAHQAEDGVDVVGLQRVDHQMESVRHRRDFERHLFYCKVVWHGITLGVWLRAHVARVSETV